MPRKNIRQRGRKTPLKTLTNPLAVVGSPRSVPAPPPPDYLSPAMQAWWRQVMANYALEPHHVHLLEAACGAWDRMMQACKVLAEHGPSLRVQKWFFHGLPSRDGPPPRDRAVSLLTARIFVSLLTARIFDDAA